MFVINLNMACDSEATTPPLRSDW